MNANQEKLQNLLVNKLGIIKGKFEMQSFTAEEFMKIFNEMYHQEIDGSITGTINNGMTSISYDADSINLVTLNYQEKQISISRPKNSTFHISLNSVKSVNISISDNNWIDIHLLPSNKSDDYSLGYTSIVIRG